MEIAVDLMTVGTDSRRGSDGVKISENPTDHSSEQVIIPHGGGGASATIPLDPLDEPYVGQEFDSEEAAYAFCDGYASRVGFTIRKTNLYRSRHDDSPIARTFVCNKEGFKSPHKREKIIRKRAATRVGCAVKIKVTKKAELNKWVITQFVNDHNHPLTPARRGDGLYEDFSSQHEKSRELSKQLAKEKKKTATYKLLIEAYDEYQEQISKKIQEVIANMKEIEEEEARRAIVKENASDERYRIEKRENPLQKTLNIGEDDWS